MSDDYRHRLQSFYQYTLVDSLFATVCAVTLPVLFYEAIGGNVGLLFGVCFCPSVLMLYYQNTKNRWSDIKELAKSAEMSAGGCDD